MQIFGSNELVNDVLMRDLCIGCGMCVDICPYFRIHKGKTAMLFACTLEQGRCNAHCPKTEVDFEKLSQNYFNQPYAENALGMYKKIVAAKAGDKLDGRPISKRGLRHGTDLLCAGERRHRRRCPDRC